MAVVDEGGDSAAHGCDIVGEAEAGRSRKAAGWERGGAHVEALRCEGVDVALVVGDGVPGAVDEDDCGFYGGHWAGWCFCKAVGCR